MPYVDPEFTIPTVPEEEKYEGTEIDENLRKALPAEGEVIWAATHGASFWAITTKIDTELPDGSQQSYFVKVYMTAKGKAQAIGEYLSSQALYAAIPDNIPRPVGYGVLAKDSTKHFMISEFIDLIEELPPVAEFAAVIAKLHRDSVSPNRKFGFDVPTSQSLQLENTWCDTWEEFFTRAFRGTVELEQQVQGQNDELLQLAQQIQEKVIPRLLRPMEIDGRSLKPTLLHGDLWHGNVGINTMTDNVILFDCCAFYGHHEYDLGMFRQARYRTNRSHIRAYQKLIEISHPAEDFEDRNALYALRVDLEVSIGWPANKRMRTLAMEEMKKLVLKYPDGFDGWQRNQVQNR